MWPFKKKTAKDYIEQFIRIAKEVKNDFSSVYNTGKIKNIRKILLLIQRLNVNQFKCIREETGSSKLMKAAEAISQATQEALKDIDEQYSFEKAEKIIDEIIELEAYIANNFEAELKFAPSKELGRILQYSPKDAVARGYLFRGLSDHDYRELLSGNSISARVPNGTVSIAEHILDPTNNPDTQFISLTANVDVARHFGRPVAIRVNQLQGHLMTPSEIGRLTERDTRVKKLQKKNTEYLLGPSKRSNARIPANAVVR